MGNWNLLAAAFDGLETLIKIGLVMLFMIGPYLLKLLGGKAVQDDRGNGRQNRRREPQSELEQEIADFLEQSRSGSSSTVKAESAEPYTPSDFVEAETSHESLRDHHLTSTIGETDPASEAEQRSRSGVYARRPRDSAEEFQYEEAAEYNVAEEYNYEAEHQSGGVGAGAEIAAMFRDPSKVRNAFILGEIINRPKFPNRR